MRKGLSKTFCTKIENSSIYLLNMLSINALKRKHPLKYGVKESLWCFPSLHHVCIQLYTSGSLTSATWPKFLSFKVGSSSNTKSSSSLASTSSPYAICYTSQSLLSSISSSRIASVTSEQSKWWAWACSFGCSSIVFFFEWIYAI